MSKVTELRKVIQSQLKVIHPRVFYEITPDNTKFPYIVFELPNSVDDGTMENFVLEVDGWDAPTDADTMPLEQLMSNIDEALHKKVVTGEGLAFIFYRENRMSLPDDDKRIRRRKYVYQVRTFGG
ncbi:DUF3168 domain-containing protein [Paenibacillus radicis (ex Xue et al. 2023)]|uniref:DUF3168 domain-containing protein n=1 Tax=Paenibacillus radicis (ex Xue et al. 2023) TaxID=2972489 RepID=A0ABT1YRE7_9BACL|nr:DUF3168 domain-containing protein [Paenibacillus radicis (ex Xue et al. 2023)]MCR8635748.1 DUF3168 domain-containing protein [Paenibacillus radicis (ex Xue et al. 2023)]